MMTRKKKKENKDDVEVIGRITIGYSVYDVLDDGTMRLVA